MEIQRESIQNMIGFIHNCNTDGIIYITKLFCDNQKLQVPGSANKLVRCTIQRPEHHKSSRVVLYTGFKSIKSHAQHNYMS